MQLQVKKDENQLLATTVEDTQILNGYFPPREDRIEATTMLTEALEVLKIGPSVRTVCQADFNEDGVSKVDLANVMSKFGLEQIPDEEGQKAATTWAAKHKWDWYAANCKMSPMTRRLDKISDHKIVASTVWIPNVKERKTGVIEKGNDYKKPSFMSKVHWKCALEGAWLDTKQSKEMSQYKVAKEASVDIEWKMYMEVLDRLHRTAYRKICEDEEGKPAQEEGEDFEAYEAEVKRMSKLKHIVKGCETKRKMISQEYGSTMESKAMREKKRRKLWGRCLHLESKLKKDGLDCTKQDPEGRALIDKVLTRTEMQQCLEDMLKTLKEKRERSAKLVEKEEAAVKTCRLKEWRQRMASGVKEVAKWIRAKKTQAVELPQVEKGEDPIESREDAVNAISKYWKEVWAYQNDGYKGDEKEQLLLKPLRKQFRNAKLAKVTKKQKMQILRS